MILSAKHGQSPDTPSAVTRIPDGPILEPKRWTSSSGGRVGARPSRRAPTWASLTPSGTGSAPDLGAPAEDRGARPGQR
ncbi:MAG TPA: hypothetical protein VN671_11230, partial [Solirubrobacterales bacterium]|nr:hypothetical protein [Solirubrobacterales bacterium]